MPTQSAFGIRALMIDRAIIMIDSTNRAPKIMADMRETPPSKFKREVAMKTAMLVGAHPNSPTKNDFMSPSLPG